MLYSNSKDLDSSPQSIVYINDIFSGHRSFEAQYAFLKDHFFPRIEWANLRLSFKKLRVFVRSIKALEIRHEIGGLVKIVKDRIRKISHFPEPRDQIEVRIFIGVIGITYRWVKNFDEIARPLYRLLGKVK